MSNTDRTPDLFRIWGHGEFAHICFESPGCRYRKAGYCVMCDYGSGRKLTPDQTVTALKTAFKSWGHPIKRLLLGTCGSIFDETEMSCDSFDSVLSVLDDVDLGCIIFETHYETVTLDILKKITSVLHEKKIMVELGFESSNSFVLQNSLNKYMDLEALLQTMQCLHSYQIGVILNVFLGAPGLNAKEQVIDSLQSIHWAYDHGADEVVVFPANVKPNTLLWKLWKNGNYEVPNAWLLVELLQQLSDRELETTSISWYGDRQFAGQDLDIIPPETCPACYGLLQQLFEEYMKDCNSVKRRQLLQKICNTRICSCQEDIAKQLK